MAVLSPSFFEINGPLLTVIPHCFIDLCGGFFANFFFFKAFEKSDVSVATPVLALTPGFTFLFAGLFLGDAATLFQFVV